jgi:ketosteroid isomerase-like protein
MPEESTTPDLVELTRELAEAQGVDATMRFHGADSVYDPSNVGLGVFEGHAAIRGFLEDWLASYEEAEDEAEEVIELSSGVVFAVVRGHGRPSGSPRHVQVHGRHGVVVAWADGLVARVTIYTDTDEARAAAERLAESRG